MKKIVSIVLILTLMTANFPAAVFAQEATESAVSEISPTPEPSPTPTLQPTPTPEPTPISEQSLPTLSQEVTAESTTLPVDTQPAAEFESAATIRLPIHVRTLTKRVY